MTSSLTVLFSCILSGIVSFLVAFFSVSENRQMQREKEFRSSYRLLRAEFWKTQHRIYYLFPCGLQVISLNKEEQYKEEQDLYCQAVAAYNAALGTLKSTDLGNEEQAKQLLIEAQGFLNLCHLQLIAFGCRHNLNEEDKTKAYNLTKEIEDNLKDWETKANNYFKI